MYEKPENPLICMWRRKGRLQNYDIIMCNSNYIRRINVINKLRFSRTIKWRKNKIPVYSTKFQNVFTINFTNFVFNYTQSSWIWIKYFFGLEFWTKEDIPLFFFCKPLRFGISFRFLLQVVGTVRNSSNDSFGVVNYLGAVGARILFVTGKSKFTYALRTTQWVDVFFFGLKQAECSPWSSA